MTNSDRPTGRLFTDIYCEKSDPTQDSATFRMRIGAYVQSTLFKEHWELHQYLRREAGIQVEMTPTQNSAYHQFEKMFNDLPLLRLLNAITLIWRYLWEKHKKLEVPDPSLDKLVDALKLPSASPLRTAGSSTGRRPAEWVSLPAIAWRDFVARCIREENLGYDIDAKGGLHPLVDKEFELNRESALRGLSAPRYSAVRAAFEDAHRNLGLEHQNTKAAVRSMFESLEILTKLLIPSASRLDDGTVRRDLKPLVQKAFGTDSTAEATAGLLVESFAKWVNSLHAYRHGQATEDPVAPPTGLAIYVVSSGAAWLRVLLEVDQAVA